MSSLERAWQMRSEVVLLAWMEAVLVIATLLWKKDFLNLFERAQNGTTKCWNRNMLLPLLVTRERLIQYSACC